jgi:hypothetical protein
MMDENILAAVLLNKPEPLRIIKPLDSPFCHGTTPLAHYAILTLPQPRKKVTRISLFTRMKIKNSNKK